jgi:hypothetical protein
MNLNCTPSALLDGTHGSFFSTLKDAWDLWPTDRVRPSLDFFLIINHIPWGHQASIKATTGNILFWTLFFLRLLGGDNRNRAAKSKVQKGGCVLLFFGDIYVTVILPDLGISADTYMRRSMVGNRKWNGSGCLFLHCKDYMVDAISTRLTCPVIKCPIAWGSLGRNSFKQSPELTFGCVN